MQYATYALSLSSQQLITKWLKQRQALLVTLYDLCHKRPFFFKFNCQELQGTLQEFGGQILDYLSLGHFKIYENLVGNVEQQLSFVVEQLNESTQQIMNLNERQRFHLNPMQIDKDLSALAEKLAKRFALEDKLISSYLFSKPRRKKGVSWLN